MTANELLTPLSGHTSDWKSRDHHSSDVGSDVSYDVVLGVLLFSFLLVVLTLAVYLCTLARLNRCRRHLESLSHVTDDVTDHVMAAPSTALTSLGSSSASPARSKEVEDSNGGLLKSLLGRSGTGNSAGSVGGGDAVTWYGSRDVVQVGRPANVRYVSLRRYAYQSSSVESESGAVPPTTPNSSQATKRLTPLLPKRFGFVGWTRANNATPVTSSGESMRHQTSTDVTVTSPPDEEQWNSNSGHVTTAGDFR